MSRVIVDAGPLVALLWERDPHHRWMRDTVAGVRQPLLTCEPVIAEAAHLLRRQHGGRVALLELLAKGVITIAFRLDTELSALKGLIERYASVPMSLADACVVRMCELAPDAAVLTLDADFRVYRRDGRHSIPMIRPRHS